MRSYTTAMKILRYTQTDRHRSYYFYKRIIVISISCLFLVFLSDFIFNDNFVLNIFFYLVAEMYTKGCAKKCGHFKI